MRLFDTLSGNDSEACGEEWMSVKRDGSTKSTSSRQSSAGTIKPAVGIAAGAVVGSAAIAAALIFSGRLRNPFVDAPSESPGRGFFNRLRKVDTTPAAFASGTGADGAAMPVRDAGPDNVRDPEPGRAWSREDQASDESFPASDPPATY
jgi:hypothetical protein